MPIKLGGKKYAKFSSAVAAKKREGYSDESARKIVGAVEAKQHPKKKRKN